ncbi:MAG: hydroxyisourate hydrolase [Elusimicrobia bacterium]|nr:hydroxyisourate hydrolase [Elusimicrobiota bacterium]
MSAITTHVLDVSRGKPAAGVPIVLERLAGKESWKELGKGTTDADGRLKTLSPSGAAAEPGVYRLTFDTAAYFQQSKSETFYPSVSVVFEIKRSGEHYHVPLLLSPFGYSTYRGS